MSERCTSQCLCVVSLISFSNFARVNSCLALLPLVNRISLMAGAGTFLCSARLAPPISRCCLNFLHPPSPVNRCIAGSSLVSGLSVSAPVSSSDPPNPSSSGVSTRSSANGTDSQSTPLRVPNLSASSATKMAGGFPAAFFIVMLLLVALFLF